MKIAVIQASSQKDKNDLLFHCVNKATKDKGHEVINFGVFKEEDISYSYIQTALCISLLLESKLIDFVITGCSSGQGMMLACNSLPGILCGYVENPSDSYLFGRINDGNAVSYPLGLNFGWAAELNLQSTLDKLFEDPFGMGYPQRDAERKKSDTLLLKKINMISKKSLLEILPLLDENFIKKTLQRNCVYSYIMKNSRYEELKGVLKKYRNQE
ncbi:MAG: RpiB/LacA/LacB family sugar-phosphate isomerase [Selenomonadaceae bacterium]